MKTPCTDSYSQQQKEEKLRRDTTKHHKQNKQHCSTPEQENGSQITVFRELKQCKSF